MSRLRVSMHGCLSCGRNTNISKRHMHALGHWQSASRVRLASKRDACAAQRIRVVACQPHEDELREACLWHRAMLISTISESSLGNAQR